MMRWLVPSLADILFLSLIAWPYLAAGNDGWAELLADANTGIHIRTGDWILASGQVPVTDPFSFSRPDQPWFAWEWLTAILYSGLHSALGLAGIAVFSAFLLFVFAVQLLRNQLSQGATVLIALPLALASFRASSIHFLARPHLISWILFATAVALVNRDRRSHTRAVWLLVPLAALWANMHGGFILLPFFLAITAAGSACEAILARKPGKWLDFRRYSLLALVTAAATVLNPYGFALHRHIIEFLRSPWITQRVQEFLPPWTFPGERVYLYFVLLAISILCGLGLLRQKRCVEVFWIAAFAYASVTSARHIPIFLLAVTPVIGAFLSELWRAYAASGGKRALRTTFNAIARDATPGLSRISLWVPVFWIFLALSTLRGTVLNEFPPSRFPARLVDRHADLLAGSRVFTRDAWADYLIYRNYPRQRAFFDGRNDFYGPQIGEQYLDLLDGGSGWQNQFACWDFKAAMVAPESGIAKALAVEPGWTRLDADKIAVLFARESTASAPAGRNLPGDCLHRR